MENNKINLRTVEKSAIEQGKGNCVFKSLPKIIYCKNSMRNNFRNLLSFRKVGKKVSFP